MKGRTLHFLSLVCIGTIGVFSSCGNGEEAETATPAQSSTVSQKPAPGGWIDLSADPTLAAWSMQKPGAWKTENGVMEKSDGGGYIWTKERFGDFVLECDFKIDEGGNSGIFFRTGNTGDPVQTGIEMQVYNTPRHPSPVKNDCGAIYDLREPSEYADKPAGEWNHVVLTCKGPFITVVLNDVKIVDMNLDDWDTPGMNPDGTKNKFEEALRNFSREGHIGFQEHGDPVWYRNVRIKRL